MRSGEKLGGGEVESGERSRDEERGIGARVIEAQNELVGGGDDLRGGEDENPERLRQLNEAVFEKVDIAAVLERTTKFAEKIDINRLSELRDELQENPEIGLTYAEGYFAEVLNLSLTPSLRTDVDLDEGTLGGCINGGEYNDRIRIDLAQHGGDMDSALVTLAHENWHSYQHDVMRRVRNGEGSEELGELAKLYEYNNKSYVRADLDYEGYRRQLCETEARAFEFLVGAKLEKVRAKEREEADFMAAHPEVYGEENLPGIEREVDKVLHGMDLPGFLRQVGAGSFDELWDIDENEELTQKYARALSELVGLERPIDLEFVDRLENNKKAYLSYKTGKVLLSRKQTLNFRPLSGLPKIAWMMRQREVVRNDPESERGRAYKVNFGMYIHDGRKTHEAYRRQLLKRESDYFADELLNVLDEQATLEDIERMSPEERAEMEKERERLGWEPVTSQKYEVIVK